MEGNFRMRQLSVVVPTFCEAENLAVLVPRLCQVFTDNSLNGEIIVVDDNSPDNTVDVVRKLSESHPVRLIVRTSERGLSSAVIAGMLAADGEVLLCMDADLSHPPEDVPKLFQAIAGNRLDEGVRSTSFVIGSRYVTGGSTESGWGLGRWLNSKGATLLAWPLTSVSDPMAGFFALRHEDFRKASGTLDPIGYKIGLELLVKTNTRRALEVPIEFKNRLHGESKLSLREQLNYLRHLARLYRFRFPKLTRFVSFGFVGASGAIVDLLMFLLLLHAGLAAWPAAVLAIWMAMTSNFVLNRKLTFAGHGYGWPREYLAFCLSCFVGAVVNSGVRVGLISALPWFAQHAWAAAMLGILSGLAFNFSLCERFAFRQSKTNPMRERRRILQEAPNLQPPETSAFAHASGDVTGAQRGSWLFRGFVVLAVISSVVWARGLWSQTRKPTERLQPTATEPSRPLTSMAKAKSNVESQSSAKGAATTSARLPLNSHLGFGFSDIDIEQRLRADARYLASDELEGRGTQTAGIDKASEYIAREFAEAGLNTNSTERGAFHEFPLLTREAVATVSQVTLQDPHSVLHAIARGRDFSSVIVPKPKQIAGVLVFAGFGISAPQLGYDDFADLDVRGRVLVVLRSEPTHANWKTQSNRSDAATHALLRTKIREALGRQAAALVLCDPKSGLNVPADAPDLLSIDLSAEFPSAGMPVMHVRRQVLCELLSKAAHFDLEQAEAEINSSLKPQSQVLKNVSLAVRIERPKVSRTLKNVIGTIEGQGPHSSETIVVGAHYDHLGYGGWGSLEMTGRREIHNGADDNASGTVVLLEAARQLASLHHQKPLARRVCFIAFSSEELGLIGSKKYVQEPWFPIESTVAMLNLDMVGRLRNNHLTVYGVGTSPIWTLLLRPLAKEYQLGLQLREGGYGPSDHASFFERGVPVLHFFTGFHAEYHRPSDDSDLLNYRGMKTLSHVITELAWALSELADRPSQSTPRLELAELKSPTALGDVVGMRMSPAKFQLGVQLSPSEQGVLVRGTLPHSLAQRHGIRSGDLIESINGQRVGTPAEAIAEIQKHARQESLVVNVTRNGLRLKISITE